MSSQKTFQSHKKLTTNEYRSYTHHRQQVYGQNVSSEHPTPQAERDYDEYKKWCDQSNESVADYKKTLKGREWHNPEIRDLQRLQQHRHQQMVSPDAQAATDTNWHATTRNAFLDKHPFAYGDLNQRYEHELRADRSIREAEFYREAYDTHYQNSGPHQSRPVRQAPYGSYGSSSSVTPGLPRRAPVEPRPAPSQSSGSRIPTASEAYGSYYATGRRN